MTEAVNITSVRLLCLFLCQTLQDQATGINAKFLLERESLRLEVMLHLFQVGKIFMKSGEKNLFT